MNKYSLSTKFYLLETGNGKESQPIYCRITVNRKKAEFNSHLNVLPKHWDEKKQRIKGSPEINASLIEIERKISGHYSDLQVKGKTITAQLLRDLCTERNITNYRLLDYYSRFLIEIEALTNDYTYTTIQKYRTIKIHLESYLKQKNETSILMSDFTTPKMNEFEYYLKTVAKIQTNTASKYLKQVKTIFYRAVRFGFIEIVPFQSYRFKSEQTKREFLTIEDIEKLESFIAPNDSLNRVKDIFLFSVFTGLRFSDVHNLKPSNLRIDNKGNHWIEFTMIKTDKNMNVPIMNKALEILKLYKGESEMTGKLLPVISNQKINAYLKVLGDLVGINKPLTYHMARHTFATTITLSNEVPIEVVSKMLGHSNLKTTQIYAKITNDYLLKTTELLNKKIK